MNQFNTWTHSDDRLHKQFKFKDFSEAFSFMVRVAMESEKMNHHPTWKNAWNIVDIWLNTHDADGKVTEKDYSLSERIDVISTSYET